MRNRESIFIGNLQSYLKSFFSQRAAEENIEDIKLWQDGYAGIISGLTHYPGCIVIVDGRTITGAFTARYEVLVYVGVSNADPTTLETTGRIWQDILEDAIRNDWTLGGACLQVLDGVRIRPGATGDVYTAGMSFTCEVDTGGYVYDESYNDNTDGSEE